MRARVARLVLVAAISIVVSVSVYSVAAAGSWSDVPDSVLASYGVTDAQVKAISSGYSNGTFQPSRSITRAQFVKMAAAAFGITGANPSTPTFTDVPTGNYYYGVIEAAYAHGLVSGIGQGKFGPDVILNREQAIAIIVRGVAAAKNFDLASLTQAQISAALVDFGDATAVSAGLRDEMAYALINGITKGNSSGDLAPKSEIGRLAAATLLIRAGSSGPPNPPGHLTITNVLPAVGPVAGGNTVTISGSGLSGATSVTFGTQKAVVVSDSDTEIKVTVPAGTKGHTVAVTVTTSKGTTTLSESDAAYQYTGAQSSLTLWLTDKGGVKQKVATWTYDDVAHTYRDGAAEVPFVKTFTGSQMVRYSGTDAGNFQRLGAMTKGILLTDLTAYVANAAGVSFDDETKFSFLEDNSGPTNTLGFLSDRYYYPSFVTSGTFDEATRVAAPTALAIESCNVRNNTDTAKGLGSPFFTRLNGGTPVVPADDAASLQRCFSILGSAANDSVSARVMQGQKSSSPGDLNLGSLCWYSVNNVVFSPAYHGITATAVAPMAVAAAVVGGTPASPRVKVTTDDGYLKATTGEPVSFTVSDVTPGYEPATVSVIGASGIVVPVSEADGRYSFTMPGSPVTIDVALRKD